MDSLEHEPVSLQLMEEERKRIRLEEELRHAIRTELADSTARKPRSLDTVLNSPFIITVIGGLAIALVGSLLQNNAAEYQRIQLRQQALQDRRADLLRSFSTDLHKSVHLLMTARTYNQWLSNPHHGPDRFRRSEAQVIKAYENTLTEYYNTPQEDTLFAQLDGLYYSLDVQTAKVNLRSTIRLLKDDPDATNNYQLTTEYDSQVQLLVAAMAKETRQTSELAK